MYTYQAEINIITKNIANEFFLTIKPELRGMAMHFVIKNIMYFNNDSTHNEIHYV